MPTPTPTDTTPAIGTPVESIETPALTVDLDVMERNLERYARFAEEQGVRLRAHAKTHKTPALAGWQVDRTGGGICCQTLSEAEVMAAGGIDDIYLSYMVVGESKLARLCRLNESLDAFATTVDGPGNVDPLASAAAAHDTVVDTVVEVDVGLGRTGTAGRERAVEVVERVADASHLSVSGLLAYEANVKSEAETDAEFEARCTAAMDEAAAVVDRLADAGHEVPEVKVGGTATSLYSGRHPVVDEINPGMFVFMDVGELSLRPWAVSPADCAATVRSTVISAPATGRAVADAGSKSLGMDKPERPVPRREGVSYVAASEEHGWLETEGEELAVGDRLDLIVPHVCTTINLHDTIVGVRDGRVETTWNVQARGKVK